MEEEEEVEVDSSDGSDQMREEDKQEDQRLRGLAVLPSLVKDALLQEVDKIFQQAVVDGILQEDCEFKTPRVLEELYQQLPTRQLLPTFTRICYGLSNLLHSHYLQLQWHTAPFDERNDDEDYLHRCPMKPSTPFGLRAMAVTDEEWDQANREAEYALTPTGRAESLSPMFR
ncbi:unnamed protein product, partial [Chrysoparadoxa australica]